MRTCSHVRLGLGGYFFRQGVIFRRADFYLEGQILIKISSIFGVYFFLSASGPHPPLRPLASPARLLAAREAVRRAADVYAGGHDPGGADAGLQRPARGVRGGGVRGGVAGCRQQRV